jgi:peroxiredoxin Q/BCP
LAEAGGEPVALSDFRGRNLVLYFYPAAMTPGCTKEAVDFQDNSAAFAAAGYQIIGVSPDTPDKLASFRDAEQLTFPLLADPDKATLIAYGAYGEKKLYGKTVTGVIRSTFVIDGEGTVTAAQYNVRATGHVAKLRRDLHI